MPKARDFAQVEKVIQKSLATGPDYPPTPTPYIGTFDPLTEDELEGIAKGYGQFGYPLIEPIARRPGLVRLLLGKDTAVKYEATKPTHFLQALRTFEESDPRPIRYKVTVSDLINSPYTTFSGAPQAASVLRNTKKAMSSIYGVQFTNLSYILRFAQIDDFHRSREYHELNIIKAGHRAAKLGAIAYTRGLLGDPETSTISEDVIDIAERGREIYAERYHRAAPARELIQSPLIPRHLL